MSSERVFEVPPEYAGWRLDRFLAARVVRLTRSKAAAICRSPTGGVTLEPPRRVKPATILREGDRVVLRRPDTSTGAAWPLIVLYRDPFVMVVNKPSGVLVQPTARVFADTLVVRLAQEAGPGEHLEPVHRLDRETSGALMVSRIAAAVPVMRQRFAREGRASIDKLYVAAVDDPEGRWAPGDGASLTAPLGLDPDSPTRVRVWSGDLPARTDVQCIERMGARALLTCQLHTGRQHQIRVHLAMEGTPVAGDKLYQMGEAFFRTWCDHPGDPALAAQLSAPRLLLHAARLGWRCPWTDEARAVDAPLPEGFGLEPGSTPWKKVEPGSC